MTAAGAPLAAARTAGAGAGGRGRPTMVTGSFVSAARGGVNTNWAIARPPGQTAPLRPVIALHGKGSDAAGVMAGGVEQGLAQAVAAGLPPFAVVAVDGGGSYWHKRASGEDSGAMVLDELIPMLGRQGLDTSRVAFLGWSMGGYGALLLGARLGPARTAAISAVSPGAVDCRRARPRRAHSTAPTTSPPTVCSGLPALGSIPIRIDCGNSDPFYSATQAVHRPAAESAGRRLLPGRARRRLLEFAAAGELTWIRAAAHRPDNVRTEACTAMVGVIPYVHSGRIRREQGRHDFDQRG